MEPEKTGPVKINIMEILNQKLTKLSSNNAAVSIYRVAQKLRKANEAAYTPRLVSIGPLHHGLPQLQAMEACKLRFLNNFLSRFGISLRTLVDFSEKNESSIRAYYEGMINLSHDQLAQMILLDGVFIVELFLENHFFQLRDRNEMVFKNNWIFKDLLHDMMLVENQLPITISKGLLDFVDFSFLNNGNIKLTIYDLAHKFFKDVGNTQRMPLTPRCHEANHFVELLLILHAPLEPKQLQTSAGYTTHNATKSVRPRYWYIQKLLLKSIECTAHIAMKIIQVVCWCRRTRSNTSPDYTTRSATELRQAGVQFTPGEDSSLFKINFNKKTGMLTVPKLTVNHSTETFFRNLIAFEQCGYSCYYSEDITSYVILMDSFINTPYDVDLLVKAKIIRNELGESQKVADLFNNLHKEVVTEANIFYFDKLCQDLNKYSKDPAHKLLAKTYTWWLDLKRDYLKNPWTTASVIAALVLLALTVAQTVCSILQVI